MKEISQMPWNGYNVVSTFSGGGGSCLGYRMAGYHVVWANEFVPAAQETYTANHPDTFLNTTDIREVDADTIFSECGLSVGQIDLFDGSPPCASFSTAGSRERAWGKKKSYSDTFQRTDDLFFEYTRLLRDLQPKTFVAENVSGLVKGTSRGYFKEILREMKSCGYEVSARLLNAAFLGVPQKRERIIFVGVRKDLCQQYDVRPTHPVPEKHVYTVGDAISDIENDPDEVDRLLQIEMKHPRYKVLLKMPKNPKKTLYGGEFANGSYFNLRRESMYQPCATICQSNGRAGSSGNCHPLEDRKFTIAELKRLTSIPDDFVLTGNYEQQWERLGRMVPPVMMCKVARTIQTEILDKIGE